TIAAGADASIPIVIDARVVGDNRRSRFVADLTLGAEFAVFALADPYRLVVDLSQVRFSLPAGTGTEARGLVSAFRYGSISPGKSRIVLDLTRAVAIDTSFLVPPTDGQPARLVVDMVPTSQKAFMEAVRAYRANEALAVSAKRDRELIAPAAPGNNRLAIVLDPGHGGIDLGAHGTNGSLEKDLTLAYAEVLGQKLVATGLYDVYYTRTDDSFVTLGDRVDFARRHHASLFVSIHANTFGAESVRGTIIYTISDQ